MLTRAGLTGAVTDTGPDTCATTWPGDGTHDSRHCGRRAARTAGSATCHHRRSVGVNGGHRLGYLGGHPGIMGRGIIDPGVTDRLHGGAGVNWDLQGGSARGPHTRTFP